MREPESLPTLPIMVRVEQQFVHLLRLHEWDDPGWHPKRPATIRSYAAFHSWADKPKQGAD